MLTEQHKQFLDSINFAVLTGDEQFPILMMAPFEEKECAEYLGWTTEPRPDRVQGFMFTGLGSNPSSIDFVPTEDWGGWENVHPLPPNTMVATGVPHSGTHHIARVLGWEHERYFFPLRKEELDYEPEVSWFAAPFVDPEDTYIIHVVRHPLKVISSLKHRDWLSSETDYAARLAFEHTNTRDPWEFYIKWFWMCHEKAHKTMRLEDYEHLGPALNETSPPILTEFDVPSRLIGDIISILETNNYDFDPESA